jgi:hypothetical protein
MKKLLLGAFVSLFFLQPLGVNANPKGKSLPYGKPVFASIKEMEDQCVASYSSTFNQMTKPPVVTILKVSSHKNKDEVYVNAEFIRSGSPGTVKYQCLFRKGSIETYGVTS